MNKFLAICLLCLALPGCSMVTLEQKHYKNDTGAPVVQREESFASKEAMAAGATLNNVTAAKVYYQGTEAGSKESKTIYDLSLRFLRLVGVNTEFDPEDPASIESVFKKADTALLEKDKIIHDLQVDVKTKLEELATNKKIVRDKEAELEATNGKWTAKLDNVWRIVYLTVGLILAVIVGLIALQIFTKIPFFTGAIGGVSTIYTAAKQTIQGVQEIRQTLKTKIDESESEDEKKTAAELLEKLDTTLSKYQDEKVKKWVKKQKIT